MDPQRTAYAGCAHQLAHELRLLTFQLRELIHDDDQMRHFSPGGLTVLAGVIIDVVYLDFLEYPLTAVDLAVKRGKRPVDHPRTLEVVDDTRHMGQLPE